MPPTTPDIAITDIQLRLEPGQGRVAFQPLVERLRLGITSDAFGKVALTGLGLIAARLPVDLELTSARLVDGGAELVARVKKSFLKADLRVLLAFSVVDPATVRVRIADLEGPAWIPTQFVIENAMSVAESKPGFARVPDDDRAIDVNPAVVIASRGVPLTLATPGAWSIDATAAVLQVAYAAG
jgi:hypothetical protein